MCERERQNANTSSPINVATSSAEKIDENARKINLATFVGLPTNLELISSLLSTALMVRSEDLSSPGMTGKRTDVDHVFLRFGRR